MESAVRSATVTTSTEGGLSLLLAGLGRYVTTVPVSHLPSGAVRSSHTGCASFAICEALCRALLVDVAASQLVC